VSEPHLPDPAGDALRADADDARAQIRAAGITCPSCGASAADLAGTSHAVEFSGGTLPGSLPDGTAKCAEGSPVPLAGAGFDDISRLAQVDLLDAYERNWQAEMDKICGTGPAGFTGFLS
jgi:hypothetical protein